MVPRLPLTTTVFRGTTFLCATACLLLATGRLQGQADRLRLTSAELTLAQSGAVPAAFLAAAEASAERHDGDCLADFRRGAMAVAFIHLRAGPDDPANRSRARTAIEERLRCSPADGNAWLLLAETSARDGATSEKTAGLLHASRTYAPLEGWIIERRLAFACAAAPDVAAKTSAVVRADFAALLSALAFRRAAQIYETCGADVIPGLDATLAAAPQAVRAGFARAIAESLPRI